MVSEIGHQALRAAHLSPPLYAACRDALARPGHLFSPSPLWARLFLTWIDALASASRTAYLPAAVACECMAAGYDLIDAVDGRPGDGPACPSPASDLAAGVTLVLLAQELMVGLAVPGDRRARAGAILARGGRRALAGHVEDLALRHRGGATQGDALAVLRLRSGALIAAPCQCAAALTGAHWRVVALAGRFGSALGCAAQLEDDLADQAEDAHTGRKTVPILLAQTYPTDPEVVDTTTWVLMQRFLQGAARALIHLDAYARTEPLWTLLPAHLRAA